MGKYRIHSHEGQKFMFPSLPFKRPVFSGQQGLGMIGTGYISIGFGFLILLLLHF